MISILFFWIFFDGLFMGVKALFIPSREEVSLGEGAHLYLHKSVDSLLMEKS